MEDQQTLDTLQLDTSQALAALAWLTDMDAIDPLASEPSGWAALDPEAMVVKRAARPMPPRQPMPERTPLAAPTASQPAIAQNPVGEAPPLVRPQAMGSAPPQDLAQTLATARDLARKADSVQALEVAVRAFEGCPLKKTAKHTVFADGNPAADVMFIGEAPGADEDRIGRPFVGATGQLLDTMLSHIGLQREQNYYLSNILFWRPPGNRNPTAAEIAVCEPFVRKLIALVQPKALVFLGSMPTKALGSSQDGILKQRGKWISYKDGEHDLDIPAIPFLHPAYLLKQPKAKREAWMDCLKLQEALRSLS